MRKSGIRSKVPFRAFLEASPSQSSRTGRINAAEVDRHFQIAVDQIGQARIRADQSWTEFRASQKNRAGCAVVCAGAPVLGDAPSEFAEGHHEHAIEQPRCGQVGVKRLEGAGEFIEELEVRSRLCPVRVISGL